MRRLSGAGMLLALVGAAPVASGQCEVDSTFGAPLIMSVDGTALNSDIGDIDGDGHADIASAIFFSDNVEIFYGLGGGAFSAAQYLPLIPEGSPYAAAPIQPVIADLNGDGLNDLVVGVQSPDLGNPAIAIMLQTAPRVFTTPVMYAFGTQIRGVRVAHMNDDAFLDVVYINVHDNTINIMLGNGDGTFEPELFTTHTGGPSGSAIADFNGDGILDVACPLFSSNEIVIAVNDGQGNLAELMRFAATAPNDIAAGDFNNDGHIDLVTTDTGGSAIEVFLRNPDGTYQGAQRHSVGSPLALTVGDVDGDGVDDIVSPDLLQSGVTVFRSNGDGTFEQSLVFATAPIPRTVVLGDLNNDGLRDAVVSSNDNVTVLLNQCGATAPGCPCETDGDDAQVDVFDLLAYLDLWFAADAAAELTGDDPASVDVFDLLAFLDCWFPASAGAACP